ncbi:MAG: RecX family transcriptional regulator [Proteobacteria bacterium]|nr:RecX family transcriptional regulator [Pseudomonadota bacterium]
MFVTKIIRKKSRQLLYSISVDGAKAFELNADVLVKFGLRVGDELTEKDIERILVEEARFRAQRLAVNYLSYRPRSAREVARHLTRKGYAKELARSVAQKLEKAGLINDAEFANMFVRDRIKRRPVGRALLRRALQEKGIAPQLVEQVLNGALSDETQQEAARELAAKRLRLHQSSFAKLDSAHKKKRLLEYLLRRGFSNDIALKTVRSVLS